MNAIKGGIELTGTLFTSAQGSAKDKLAYAQQIFDDTYGASGEFQHNINAKVKQLDANSITPTQVDSKIQAAKQLMEQYTDAAIKNNVTDELGQSIATLGDDGKLTSTQLPTLKTINGNSIVGSGNITIDLNIYEVVTTLPTSNINPHKIYLVLSETSGTNNLYTEYAYINNAWEILGQYKANVDLTPYVSKNELTDLHINYSSIKNKTIDDNGLTINYDDVEISTQGTNLINPTHTSTLSVPNATTTSGGIMSKYDKQRSDSLPEFIITGAKSATTTTGGVNLVFNRVEMPGDEYESSSDAVLLVPMVNETSNGVMGFQDYKKLRDIAANATADSALTTAELEAILV